jgi:hypothetical protein
MMKRLIGSIFITACLWAVAYLSEPQQPSPSTPQLSTSGDSLSLSREGDMEQKL